MSDRCYVVTGPSGGRYRIRLSNSAGAPTETELAEWGAWMEWMESVMKAVTGLDASADTVDHYYCCNPAVAYCGADLTNVPETRVDDPCVVCRWSAENEPVCQCVGCDGCGHVGCDCLSSSPAERPEGHDGTL